MILTHLQLYKHIFVHPENNRWGQVEGKLFHRILILDLQPIIQIERITSSILYICNSREGRSYDHKLQERATYNYVDPYAHDHYSPNPYLGRALAAYHPKPAKLPPPYSPGYNPYGN